jgi:hypothetical protein
MFSRTAMLIVLPALILAACQHGDKVVARLEGKRDHAKAMLVERVDAGEDITPFLARTEQAGLHFGNGEVAEGEAILDAVIDDLEVDRERVANLIALSEFGAPRRVTIEGYDDTGGAMEPFISRDGNLLLFNSQHLGRTRPDLYYAERIDDLTFRYRGPVEGANSNTVDGAASMDRSGRLYFISPRDYAKSLGTIRSARFDDGAIDPPRLIAGDVSPGKPGWLNMDAEISADGETLYYCRNEWNMENNLPKTSDIHVARLQDGRYETRADSAIIFGSVNTDDLEYAPALTADERVLFFTRARFKFDGGKLVLAQTGIMVASRDSPDEPFGEPRRITTITGFVEGPTVSPDGGKIYFHRKDGEQFHLYMVTRH